MFKKLKQIHSYVLKLARWSNYLDLVRVIKYVKPSYIVPALIARANRQSLIVEIRNQIGVFDLRLFLNLMSYRKAHFFKNFSLWECQGKRFCATYTQFLGLYTEYLSGQFDEFYNIDWKNKRVLDVGGFLGDSALYMLENGASHVCIYEPIPENIFALHYNLQPYKEKIQVYQKAVAQHEGAMTLSSSHPSGSPGFGIEEGEFRVQCEGISLSRMLTQHQVDVIKMDCEGGERYIMDLSTEEMQSIPYWIVEIHNPEFYKRIFNKFESEGFDKTKELQLTPEVKLVHFRKAMHQDTVL